MAKTPNYRQQKRQKELARKSRQSEKQQTRQPRIVVDTPPAAEGGHARIPPVAPPADSAAE